MWQWNATLWGAGWRPAKKKEIQAIGDKLGTAFPVVVHRTDIRKTRGRTTRGLLKIQILKQGRENPGEAPYLTTTEVLAIQRFLSAEGWKNYGGPEEDRLENYFPAEKKWYSYPGEFTPTFPTETV